MITNHWVWSSPVFGKIIQYAGFFHVDEGYELCVERMREKVREGYSIAIFPEGTRTYDGKMKRFHKGAFYLSETLQLDISYSAIRQWRDYSQGTTFLCPQRHYLL